MKVTHMKIAISEPAYAGRLSAACLADSLLDVVGAYIGPTKIAPLAAADA